VDFFKRLHFSPHGALALKFLHVLRIVPKRDRDLPKNFKGEDLKFGLKLSIWVPITLGLVGITSWNISMWLAGGRRDTEYDFWTPQFDNFRLWWRISLQQIDVTKIRKALDKLHSIPYLAKKIGELWSTNKKVIGTHVDPPNVDPFLRDYISALMGCCPLKFFTRPTTP